MRRCIRQAKIYLFGSRGRGTNDDRADIDIALEIDETVSRYDIYELKEILSGITMPYKIDIVDMKKIPETLRQTILKEGVVWRNGKIKNADTNNFLKKQIGISFDAV